jgi:hypothetical protein
LSNEEKTNDYENLVKFSKSVISRSNSLKIFPMKKNYAEYRFHQNQQIYKMRQLFTKFRVSDHSLEIESGRYKNITREERICKNCNLNEIGETL